MFFYQLSNVHIEYKNDYVYVELVPCWVSVLLQGKRNQFSYALAKVQGMCKKLDIPTSRKKMERGQVTYQEKL